MKDQNLIELFLEMILTERAASLNTIESYRRDLEQFIVSVPKLSGKILLNANRDDLRKYLSLLEKNGFARRLRPENFLVLDNFLNLFTVRESGRITHL